MESNIIFIKLIASIFLRYLRSNVLLYLILPLIFSILMIATATNQTDLFVSIIGYLAKLNFINGNELDGSDFMKIFFNLSLVIFIVIEVINYLLKKLKRKEINFNRKKILIVTSGLIAIIYIIALLLLPYANIEKGSELFFYLFILFCMLVSLVSNLLLFAINILISKIKIINVI